jgi:type IV secretory pathway TraG/TraD family ATPase VirD4
MAPTLTYRSDLDCTAERPLPGGDTVSHDGTHADCAHWLTLPEARLAPESHWSRNAMAVLVHLDAVFPRS